MAQALLYDPIRLRALGLRTAAAAQWLDGRSSAEPMADASLASLRRIAHTLATVWLPHLASVLGDTSMTGWDEHGPDVSSGSTTPTSWFRSTASAEGADVRPDQVAAEMVRVAALVAAGDLAALLELDAMFVEHADDPAVTFELLRQLGDEGFVTLVTALDQGDMFVGGVLASAEARAARDRVLATLVPTPMGIPSDPDFDLRESIVAGTYTDWFARTHPGCVDIGGANADYTGGGFAIGPDGREYPIVVPTVTDGENIYTADIGPIAAGEPCVNNLGGTDDGWVPVWHQSGVERFQQTPSLVDRTLGFAAGTTGAVTPLLPSSGLSLIQVRPDALPYLAGPAGGPQRPVGSADPSASDTIEDPPTADAVIDLAVRGADGWVVATNLDNQRERVYQVVFEEHPATGRTRARIETYSLALDADGDTVIVPEHVWVDGDGNLMSQGITYAPVVGATGTWSEVTPLAFEPGVVPDSYRVHDQAFP